MLYDRSDVLGLGRKLGLIASIVGHDEDIAVVLEDLKGNNGFIKLKQGLGLLQY